MESSRQRSLDAENAEFWNELCGSGLAQSLGITDHTLDSLRAFDEAYLRYYPYLLDCIPVSTFAACRVLEVGLGYGTLGQKIIEAGADYTGLDIATGPVRMMKHRLLLQNLPGSAQQGSVLDCPFPEASFDCVVSVGCIHHTGNAQRAIDELWRVLRPGGRAYVMVYNKFSVRQWLSWPLATAGELARQLGLNAGGERTVTREQRMAYDPTPEGKEAPETRFFSASELHAMFGRFTSTQVRKENCDPLLLRGRQFASRESLLGMIGPIAGLDLYVTAIK